MARINAATAGETVRCASKQKSMSLDVDNSARPTLRTHRKRPSISRRAFALSYCYCIEPALCGRVLYRKAVSCCASMALTLSPMRPRYLLSTNDSLSTTRIIRTTPLPRPNPARRALRCHCYKSEHVHKSHADPCLAPWHTKTEIATGESRIGQNAVRVPILNE